MANPEPEDLSERELEILRLVATGASNKEIAQQLFISSNTVKAHLRNIFGKIGAASRTEAAMYCVRTGLVETETRQITPEIAAPTIEQTPTFPRPTDIEPDVITSTPQKASSRQWMLAAGLGFIIILLVALSISLFGNGNPLVNSPSTAQATSTPIQQWFLLEDLPTPRSGLAAVGYEGKIYAIAGEAETGPTGIIELFDPGTGTWIELSSKPTPVTDICAAVIGGKIYLPGGRLASGEPASIMEVFDPNANVWTEGANLPKSISAYAMTTFEGRLYVFGGWDGQQYLHTLFIYDPDLDRWMEGPNLPAPRGYASAVATENRIYVLGGTNGEQALVNNDIFQPDNMENQPWTQGAPLPEGRYKIAAANIADIIHLFGGTGNDQGPLGLAYVAQQNEWRQIDTPIKQNSSSLAIATLGTRLYILGGRSLEGLNEQVWSYQAIFVITLPLVR